MRITFRLVKKSHRLEDPSVFIKNVIVHLSQFYSFISEANIAIYQLFG